MDQVLGAGLGGATFRDIGAGAVCVPGSRSNPRRIGKRHRPRRDLGLSADAVMADGIAGTADLCAVRDIGSFGDSIGKRPRVPNRAFFGARAVALYVGGIGSVEA